MKKENQKRKNYVYFYSVQDTRGEVRYTSWPEFIKSNQNPPCLTRKDRYPLFGPFVPKEDKVINSRGQQTHRTIDAVAYYSMAVLDIDKEVPDNFLDILKERFDGICFVCFTTYNHTQEHQRWRVVFPFPTEVLPIYYPTIIKNIIAYSGLSFDKCSYSQAHIFYYASVKQGQKAICYVNEGKPIDVDKWSKETYHQCFERSYVGQYSQLKMNKLIKEYLGEFFIPTRDPNRFLAVGSQSKIPGVVVRGGSVYIHHTNAFPQLSQRFVNGFELFQETMFKGNTEKCRDWMTKQGLISGQEITPMFFEEGLNREQKATKIIKELPAIKNLLAYNDFYHRMTYTRTFKNANGSIIGKKDEPVETFGLNVLASIITRDFGLNVGNEKIFTFFQEDSWIRKYHPIKQWIESKRWDGQDYIGTFLKEFGVAEHYLENKFISVALKKYMIGCLHTLYHGDEQFDAVLLFQGEKFTGKSSAIKCLANKWYQKITVEELSGINNKDAIMKMHRSFISNFDEFDTHSKKDEQAMKILTSSQEDSLRLPYERFIETFKRHYSLAGTTNTMDVIRDEALSRRLWLIPVEVHYLDKMDFMDKLKSPDYSLNLWSQAKYYLDNGEPFRLTREEIKQQEEINREFVEENPWVQTIKEYMENNDSTFFSSKNLIEYSDPYKKYNMMSKNERRQYGMEISRAAKILGYSKPTLMKVQGVATKVWKESPVTKKQREALERQAWILEQKRNARIPF